MAVYEVAVLGKQFPGLSPEGKTHTFSFNLDITSDEFKQTFMNKGVFNVQPNGLFTKIDKIIMTASPEVSPISMDSAYELNNDTVTSGTSAGVFYLREAILACAQEDLNSLTSTNVAFTPISLIKWTKEVNNITDLSNLAIIDALRLRDITTMVEGVIPTDTTLNITSVFTSSNCDILPVKLVMSYSIVAA